MLKLHVTTSNVLSLIPVAAPRDVETCPGPFNSRGTCLPRARPLLELVALGTCSRHEALSFKSSTVHLPQWPGKS